MQRNIRNMDVAAEPPSSEHVNLADRRATDYGATCTTTISTNHIPWYKHISVEPIILLHTFSFALTTPVLTTLFLTHTCRSMGFNQSYCSQLEGKDSSENLETLVQPPANLMALYAILIETALPAVMTFFVGAWSDVYGRRTFLISPMTGFFLKHLVLLFISFFPTLPAHYILLSSVPVALSGGFISLLTMSYCYVTDGSDLDTRGFRLGMVEWSYYAGMLLGNLTSSSVFIAGSYAATFTMAAALHALAILHGVFWVRELIPITQDGDSCCNIFRLRYPREMFSVLSNKRLRTVVLLAAFAMALSVVTIQGEGTVAYLMTRKKFSWDITLFTVYSCAYLVMNVFGTIIALTVLTSWLSDGVLSCVALCLTFVSSVLLGFSPHSWYMYLSAVVGMFNGVPAPLVRAVVTKNVEPHDMGKVLMLMSCVESVTPLVSSPLYALVYNATIVTFPGAFYLVSAGLFMINGSMIGVIVWIGQNSSAATKHLIQS